MTFDRDTPLPDPVTIPGAPACEERDDAGNPCSNPAQFTNSVPDSNKPGIGINECGYRLKHLCWSHARAAKRISTSRVEKIEVGR